MKSKNETKLEKHKKKTKMTVKQAEALVEEFVSKLNDAHIPHAIIVAHPDDEAGDQMLSFGGSIETQVVLPQIMELEAKHMILEAIENEPGLFPQITKIITKANKEFGKARSELQARLRAVLEPEAEKDPFDGVDMGDPEAVLKVLLSEVQANKDSASVQVIKMPKAANKADVVN